MRKCISHKGLGLSLLSLLFRLYHFLVIDCGELIALVPLETDLFIGLIAVFVPLVQYQLEHLKAPKEMKQIELDYFDGIAISRIVFGWRAWLPNLFTTDIVCVIKLAGFFVEPQDK